MRRTRTLATLSLLLALHACGGGSPVPEARRQLAYGNLDRAEQLLAGIEDEGAQAVLREVQQARAARQDVERALEDLRAGRDGRELDAILYDLDQLLSRTSDPVSQEAVRVEKSRTVDWDAEGRASGFARVGRHDPNTRPLRPGETTDPRPTRPLEQLLVDEARAHARAGRFVQAHAELERALADAPGSTLLLEALDEVRAGAEQEARAVLDLVRAQESVSGARLALSTLTERSRNLPADVLEGRLARRATELRALLGEPEPVVPRAGPSVAGVDDSARPPAAGPANPVVGEAIATPEELAEDLAQLPRVELDPALFGEDPTEIAVRAGLAEAAGDLPRARALWHVAARGAYGLERLRYDTCEYALGARELLRHALRRQGRAGADGFDWQDQRVPWDQLSPFALAFLDQEGTLTGDAAVGLALERATRGDAGERAAGLASLHERLLDGTLDEERCHSLVALVRAEALPEGGYVFADGNWVSAVEHERAVYGPQVEKLARSVRTNRGKKRAAALAELDALAAEHPFAREVRAETLRLCVEDCTRGLTRARELKRLQQLAGQRTQLDLARQHALDLIYDEVAYFYPVPDDRRAEYEKVQREVDERVAAVRALWDAPLVVPLPESFREDLEDLFQLLNVLRSSRLPEGLPHWLEGVDWTLEQVDLETFAWTAAERLELAHDRAVRALDEARWAADDTARPEEAQQVRVTNAYRQLLGRRALVWDPRLQVGARIHSDYMADTGNFSHFEDDVPARRGFGDRLREAGYDEGVSENLHRGSGSPEGAHQGWTHSSGHHRNLLMAGHREMATAMTANYWTQNFGVGTSHLADLPPAPASPWQD